MAHPIPKDLKGEERLFVIPGINIPIYKKSILYNGPASLIAVLIGQYSQNQIAFLTFFILLNIAAYPFGNGKIRKKKFDNGFMNSDKYVKQRLMWKLKGGGNVYISHKREI
jgi:hypothetical protein